MVKRKIAAPAPYPASSFFMMPNLSYKKAPVVFPQELFARSCCLLLQFLFHFRSNSQSTAHEGDPTGFVSLDVGFRFCVQMLV